MTSFQNVRRDKKDDRMDNLNKIGQLFKSEDGNGQLSSVNITNPRLAMGADNESVALAGMIRDHTGLKDIATHSKGTSDKKWLNHNSEMSIQINGTRNKKGQKVASPAMSPFPNVDQQ